MKTISQAIIEVMKDVGGVAKSMTVGSGNNAYKGVSDKDVRLLMRESMIKNGLSILPISLSPKIQIDRWEELDSYTKAMKTKQSCFTEVATKYLLLHTSGESIEVYGYGQGVDSQDKGAGKATTYALKNTLLNMFLVPTGVDTDDTHSDDIAVPQTKSAVKKNAIKAETDACPTCGTINEIKHGETGGKEWHRGNCECGEVYFVNPEFFFKNNGTVHVNEQPF